MAAWAIVFALIFRALLASAPEAPPLRSMAPSICAAALDNAFPLAPAHNKGRCASGCVGAAGCAHSPPAVLVNGAAHSATPPQFIDVAAVVDPSGGRPLTRRGSRSSRGPPLFA